MLLALRVVRVVTLVLTIIAVLVTDVRVVVFELTMLAAGATPAIASLVRVASAVGALVVADVSLPAP